MWSRFGRSTGWPRQSGILVDANTALTFLKSAEGTGESPVILFGRSLGGAVAIHLAVEREADLAAVIVENSFTSIGDMIDVLMRYLSWAKVLVANPWRSVDIIGPLNLPILFISSTRDELVPASMMQHLWRTCQSSAKGLLEYPSHHMDAWMEPTYFEDIQTWCSSHGLH